MLLDLVLDIVFLRWLFQASTLSAPVGILVGPPTGAVMPTAARAATAEASSGCIVLLGFAQREAETTSPGRALATLSAIRVPDFNLRFWPFASLAWAEPIRTKRDIEGSFLWIK